MDKFIFGKGNRSVFTIEELLGKLGLHQDVLQTYLDHVGNGLSVGGIIPGSKDEVIRLSEDTSSIVVMAPDCEVVEIPCECNHQEDDHSAAGQENPVSTEQPASESENPQVEAVAETVTEATTENSDTVTE